MRSINAAVLLAGIAIAAGANADEIVSGSISNQNLNGGACSSSSSSSTSISLACVPGSVTGGQAQLNASVTPLTASMQVNLSSYENPAQPGASTIAEANLSFNIDGTYVLTGGTGFGTVIWTADSYKYGEGGGGVFGPCSLTIAGVTETCDLNAGVPLTGTFIVPYNTPVSLLFTASYSAGSIDFDDVYSGMDFNIDPMTPMDIPKTSEPATWMLFGLAAAMIWFLNRRQVRASR
jgi:hypothetical protein